MCNCGVIYLTASFYLLSLGLSVLVALLLSIFVVRPVILADAREGRGVFMTRAQLEKKYGVQIDDYRSAYKSRHVCWVAYVGESEVARGRTIPELAVELMKLFG